MIPPINWWFFWPFCIVGVHSPRPDWLFSGSKDPAPPKAGAGLVATPTPGMNAWFGCRACGHWVPRYGRPTVENTKGWRR